MHELALAEGILGVVLDASQNQAVKRARVQVGSLQFVEPSSLEFAFEMLSEGTPAGGAKLEINEVPAIFKCKHCGKQSEFVRPPFQCESCSSFELQLLSGDEILVEEVVLTNGDSIRRPTSSFEEALREHIRQEHGQ